MERIDRTKIQEVPIQDADQSWKINYLNQLREAKRTGKPLSEIIDADKSKLDSIRIQARIRESIMNKRESEPVIDADELPKPGSRDYEESKDDYIYHKKSED